MSNRLAFFCTCTLYFVPFFRLYVYELFSLFCFVLFVLFWFVSTSAGVGGVSRSLPAHFRPLSSLPLWFFGVFHSGDERNTLPSFSRSSERIRLVVLQKEKT